MWKAFIMKADQPLLELIALKNAINEIEREKLSSKNGDNGHATFKSAGNWPSLSGLAPFPCVTCES